MVYLIFTILLYVLGFVPTYFLFDETTKQSTFNKIWFSLFWPVVSIIGFITKLISLFKK